MRRTDDEQGVESDHGDDELCGQQRSKETGLPVVALRDFDLGDEFQKRAEGQQHYIPAAARPLRRGETSPCAAAVRVEGQLRT